MAGRVRIGTAGWAIPKDCAEAFPADGSALERYAAHCTAAEINSSFHRRHRPATWHRWADSVPDDFRFSVKLPKTMTHERRLADCAALLDEFAADTAPLRAKLGALLVQLPPSLSFDEGVAESVFGQLRERGFDAVVCEPRNASWFSPPAAALLTAHGIGRVAADPAKFAGAATPGGATGIAYWRLHGFPAMYRSSYDEARLVDYAETIKASSSATKWLIFDNTASGAAMRDALATQAMLAASAA